MADVSLAELARMVHRLEEELDRKLPREVYTAERESLMHRVKDIEDGIQAAHDRAQRADDVSRDRARTAIWTTVGAVLAAIVTAVIEALLVRHGGSTH